MPSELPGSRVATGSRKDTLFPTTPAPSSPTKGDAATGGSVPCSPTESCRRARPIPPTRAHPKGGGKAKDFRGPQSVPDYVTWLTREGHTVRLVLGNLENQEAELPGPGMRHNHILLAPKPWALSSGLSRDPRPWKSSGSDRTLNQNLPCGTAEAFFPPGI